MRFFSNEAQENVDDKNADAKTDDRATHDPADPVAVPQQRAGSPWQHDTDPVPQPTAVGTSPVGDAGTVRPEDRDQVDIDIDKKDDEPVGIDGTDAGKKDTGKIDDALDDRGTFDDPHVAKTESHAAKTESHAANTDPHVEEHDSYFTETDSHTAKTGTDTDLDTAKTGTDTDFRTADTDAKADKDTDFLAVDTDTKTGTDTGSNLDGTDEPLTTEDVTGKDDPLPVPAIAREPEAATPSGPAPFFPADDTQVLRERWRDVQLRFVDDPKGATAEAAGLVDEAVDTLSRALRDQRGSLAKGSDDTEHLRVELRSYRDILDRLLGL